jgi:hypothetical protein
MTSFLSEMHTSFDLAMPTDAPPRLPEHAGGGDWYVAESRAFFAGPVQPDPASEPSPPQEP